MVSLFVICSGRWWGGHYWVAVVVIFKFEPDVIGKVFQ